nr:AsmA-like C-terminal region-containing protein [Pelagibacterium limicola]
MRTTRGRIGIDAPVVTVGDQVLLEALAFDYTWDAEDVRLRSLFGEIGGGTLELETTLCCASVLTDKSLTGRFSLNGVDIDALVEGAPEAVLSGRVTAGGRFQANGDSYRALIGTLTGSGSVSISGLTIERASPDVFVRAAAIENIMALEPEALEEIVIEALDSGSFVAREAAGLFAVTGGTVRVSNVAIEGEGARLVGGGTLALANLMVDGNWTLALTRPVGGNELITETTGRVGIGVRGPLRAPERVLDLTQMVDAIQMRAYEIELDELERLRAEQEARQRALAEEQARLMEEEARRQAEELLRQQQEEAALLAEEERQRQLDALQRQLEREDELPPPPAQQGPSIQQLPPGALQLQLLGPR